jgi:EpsI family protein
MTAARLKALLLLVAAGVTVVVARALTPTRPLYQTRQPELHLATTLPLAFAGWRVDDTPVLEVVNPVQQKVLDRIYSESLSRIYRRADGATVMLSVSYGRDQRKDLAVHYPEVCYPAQGFAIKRSYIEDIRVDSQRLPVKRLETLFGESRPEAVTYWTTVGAHHTLTSASHRYWTVQYGLRGYIADGLLFRVSSIGSDAAMQFRIQDDFIAAILKAMPERQSRWVSGLDGS